MHALTLLLQIIGGFGLIGSLIMLVIGVLSKEDTPFIMFAVCLVFSFACLGVGVEMENKNTIEEVGEPISVVVVDKQTTERGEHIYSVAFDKTNKTNIPCKVSAETFDSYETGDTILAERVVVTRFGETEEPFFRVSSENE